jgi:serine/threonine protein kinase
MDEDGYVCITDYGISKILKSESSKSQGAIGTNNYMAPEVI